MRPRRKRKKLNSELVFKGMGVLRYAKEEEERLSNASLKNSDFCGRLFYGDLQRKLAND